MVWLLLMLLTRLALLLPHAPVDIPGLLGFYVQLLLFVLSIAIAKHSSRDQRCVFVNFGIFFGYAILLLGCTFIGFSLFPDSRHALLYYYEYVNIIGGSFVLLFAVSYSIINYFISRAAILRKYVLSFSFTGVVCGFLFFRFLLNPLQLYEEPDYVKFHALDSLCQAGIGQSHSTPSDRELAEMYVASESSVPPGPREEYASALADVQKFRPYFQEGGSIPIFWGPVFQASITVSIVVLFCLGVFFLAYYRYGQPSHAYMDKILLLFFVFTSLEILHNTGGLHSYSSEILQRVLVIGHYFTIISLLGIVYAFDRKLGFVLSVAGRYYEEALSHEPAKTTTWIDGIDRLILNSFFKQTGRRKSVAHITKSNIMNRKER